MAKKEDLEPMLVFRGSWDGETATWTSCSDDASAKPNPIPRVPALLQQGFLALDKSGVYFVELGVAIESGMLINSGVQEGSMSSNLKPQV